MYLYPSPIALFQPALLALSLDTTFREGNHSDQGQLTTAFLRKWVSAIAVLLFYLLQDEINRGLFYLHEDYRSMSHFESAEGLM